MLARHYLHSLLTHILIDNFNAFESKRSKLLFEIYSICSVYRVKIYYFPKHVLFMLIKNSKRIKQIKEFVLFNEMIDILSYISL